MDLINAIKTVELETKRKRLESTDLLLIAPVPTIAEVNPVIATMSVSTFAELLAVIDRGAAIACFDVSGEVQHELLNMLRDYHLTMGVEPTVLRDLPGAEYSLAFERDTASFPSINYVTMMEQAAVASQQRLNEQLSTETKHQTEMRQATRASGHVKEFTAFAMPDGGEVDADLTRVEDGD